MEESSRRPREKRENSPRVPPTWIDHNSDRLDCGLIEAAGLAEREPLYVLAQHLSGDPGWQRHTTLISAGELELDQVAGLYARGIPSARPLFAILLGACAYELRSAVGELDDPRVVALYCAMVNVPEAMTWDAQELHAGIRKYWPDPRAYESWRRGAEVISARGASVCAKCRQRVDQHKPRKQREQEVRAAYGVVAESVAGSGRQPRRMYHDACRPPTQRARQEQDRRDSDSARFLLRAVTAVVLGDRRETDQRARWRGEPGG